MRRTRRCAFPLRLANWQRGVRRRGGAQVIEELDEKKKEALKVTWEKVNGDFGAIFSSLLGQGCSAKLEPPEGQDYMQGAPHHQLMPFLSRSHVNSVCRARAELPPSPPLPRARAHVVSNSCRMQRFTNIVYALGATCLPCCTPAAFPAAAAVRVRTWRQSRRSRNDLPLFALDDRTGACGCICSSSFGPRSQQMCEHHGETAICTLARQLHIRSVAIS